MPKEHSTNSQSEDLLPEYGVTMRAREVAKELGVSPATVYRLAERGDLKRLNIRLTGEKPAVRIQKVSVVALLTGWIQESENDLDCR